MAAQLSPWPIRIYFLNPGEATAAYVPNQAILSLK